MTNAAWKLLAEWEIRRFMGPRATKDEMLTCQSLGIPSIGLDELRVATSRGKADCATPPTWPEQDAF